MPSYRSSHRLPSIFRIGENIQRRRELRERHRARLAKPIEEMRYLDRIVTVPGCRYTVQEKDFPSLTAAFEGYLSERAGHVQGMAEKFPDCGRLI